MERSASPAASWSSAKRKRGGGSDERLALGGTPTVCPRSSCGAPAFRRAGAPRSATGRNVLSRRRDRPRRARGFRRRDRPRRHGSGRHRRREPGRRRCIGTAADQELRDHGARPAGDAGHPLSDAVDLQDHGLDRADAAGRAGENRTRRPDQPLSAGGGAGPRRGLPPADPHSRLDEPYARVRGVAVGHPVRRPPGAPDAPRTRGWSATPFIACARPGRSWSIPTTAALWAARSSRT